MLAAQALWQAGDFDPENTTLGDPCVLLPVYTRLSDAEEAERAKFAKQQAEERKSKQNSQVKVSQQALLNKQQGKTALLEEAIANELENHLENELENESENALEGVLEEKDLQREFRADPSFVNQPLEAVWVNAVEELEARTMGSDAWRASQILDELPRADRTWWAAFEMEDSSKRVVEPKNAHLIGYAGGWIVDGQVQLLKVATDHRIVGRVLRRSFWRTFRVTRVIWEQQR